MSFFNTSARTVGRQAYSAGMHNGRLPMAAATAQKSSLTKQIATGTVGTLFGLGTIKYLVHTGINSFSKEGTWKVLSELNKGLAADKQISKWTMAWRTLADSAHDFLYFGKKNAARPEAPEKPPAKP